MVDEFAEAVDAIELNDARALLLYAEGADFSSGGDIAPWPEMSMRELRALISSYLQVFNQFERLAIPTVAAAQGLCFGGGLELAIRADVIFAAETARFGHPEQSIGIVALLGGIYRVAERAGRSRAMEWALTSEPVPAKVMGHYGVVNRVISDDKLLSEAEAFVRKLASGPTLAHAAHNALLRIWATGGIAAADEAILDIAMPLFESENSRLAIKTDIELVKAGKPRAPFPFKGK